MRNYLKNINIIGAIMCLELIWKMLGYIIIKLDRDENNFCNSFL